ncbi:MAG TPA: acyl-CoA thioesterase [Cytophagaceae bacterium]
MTSQLTENKTISIRFSEVDSLQIVWHGNYVKYFEDGREAFGNRYDLNYLDVYKYGFVTPIVNINIDFKRPLKYGEKAIVQTTYVDSPAAKLIFDYKIFSDSDNTLLATGQTTQVFLDSKGDLCLTIPDFFVNWKRNWKIL